MTSPHATVLAQALDRLSAHDWRAAHALVQDLEDPLAWWIHGLVHRIEGDEPNSRYWYDRAGATLDAARSVEDEIRQIRDRMASTGV
jgi:hypothetical protein